MWFKLQRVSTCFLCASFRSELAFYLGLLEQNLHFASVYLCCKKRLGFCHETNWAVKICRFWEEDLPVCFFKSNKKAERLDLSPCLLRSAPEPVGSCSSLQTVPAIGLPGKDLFNNNNKVKKQQDKPNSEEISGSVLLRITEVYRKSLWLELVFVGSAV